MPMEIHLPQNILDALVDEFKGLFKGISITFRSLLAFACFWLLQLHQHPYYTVHLNTIFELEVIDLEESALCVCKRRVCEHKQWF